MLPPMFPLAHMLKAFVRNGSLTVIDAEGRTHVFAGGPGPRATLRLSDRTLYRKLFLNPELHAGEAYMDERLTFPGSSLREFLTLFSVNRLALGSYPLQKTLKRVSRALRGFQQANKVGKAQENGVADGDGGRAGKNLTRGAGGQREQKEQPHQSLLEHCAGTKVVNFVCAPPTRHFGPAAS